MRERPTRPKEQPIIKVWYESRAATYELFFAAKATCLTEAAKLSNPSLGACVVKVIVGDSYWTWTNVDITGVE